LSSYKNKTKTKQKKRLEQWKIGDRRGGLWVGLEVEVEVEIGFRRGAGLVKGNALNI